VKPSARVWQGAVNALGFALLVWLGGPLLAITIAVVVVHIVAVNVLTPKLVGRSVKLNALVPITNVEPNMLLSPGLGKVTAGSVIALILHLTASCST